MRIGNSVHELPLLKNAVIEDTSNSFTKLMISKQSAKFASILPQKRLRPETFGRLKCGGSQETCRSTRPSTLAENVFHAEGDLE